MPKPSAKLLEQIRALAAKHPHDIVALYSVDAKLSYGSPSHQTILGYSEDEIAGKSWKHFVAPEDHSHADLSGAAAMLHGRSLEFGFVARTKHGDHVNLRGVAWIRLDPGSHLPFLIFHGIPQPELKGAFVIRGFSLGKTAVDGEYAALRAMLLTKHYHVYPSHTLWDHHTVSQYAEEFRAYYRANRAKSNLIIGGSLGAVTAFMLAPELKPDLLVLCSLSPVFKEDKEQYVRELIGPDRTADLAEVSAKQLAAAVSQAGVKTILTYGEKEISERPELVARVKATAKAIAGAELHEISGAGHRMREPEYVAGLDQIL